MTKFKTLFLFIIIFSILAITTNAYTSQAQPKIVGGTEVTTNKYPWMAAIIKQQYPDSDIYNAQFCGGSLIDSQWILTAAHCFYESGNQIKFADDVNVVLGILDLTDTTGMERIEVEDIIIHAGYNDNTNLNDIALIKLKTTSSQSPISLVTDDAVESANVSDISTVIGWGNTESIIGYPNVLREVDIPIVSNTTCIDSYGASLIQNTNVCAGLATGGKDSCQGDSGGPLFVNDGGTYKQNGVVSFGIGCADPDYYGVYTRVSQFANWISDAKAGKLFRTISVDNNTISTIISDGIFGDTNGDGYDYYITSISLGDNPQSGIPTNYTKLISIQFEINNIAASTTAKITFDEIETGAKFYIYDGTTYIDVTSRVSVSEKNVVYEITDGTDLDHDATVNNKIIGFLAKASSDDDSGSDDDNSGSDDGSDDNSDSSGGGGGGCSAGGNNYLGFLFVMILIYGIFRYKRKKA